MRELNVNEIEQVNGGLELLGTYIVDNNVEVYIERILVNEASDWKEEQIPEG